MTPGPGRGGGTAPPEEMVYYLAVFARALDAVASYGEAGDQEGILLGGAIANALHNVPGMLRDYGPHAWHSPARMRGWIGSDFPAIIAEGNWPARLKADVAVIVRPDGAAQTLGLSPDLSDYDPAPAAVRDAHLNQLYHACLLLRLVRGRERPLSWGWFQSLPRRVYRPRLLTLLSTVTEPLRDDIRAMGRRNATLASCLWPVPFALVRWGAFDSDAYRLDLCVRSGSLDAPGHHGRDPLYDFAADPRNWAGR